MQVVLSNTTKTIEAGWSMSVWDEEKKEMVFPETSSKDTFHAKNGNCGFVLDKTLPDEKNFIVTIKISKWFVTEEGKSVGYREFF